MSSPDADANLDEFLNMLEEGSEDGPEVAKAAVPGSPPRDLSKLTSEDIFGTLSPSPKKKRRKTTTTTGLVENHGWLSQFGGETSTSTAKGGSGAKKNLSLDLKPKSIVATNSKVAPGLDTNQYVIDHFSRIRLYRTSIALYFDDSMSPESVLKERNLGLQYVSLMSLNLWFRTKKGDEKNIWTSGVLVRKQPGMRKSAKGNEYAIWEVNDLKEVEKCWSLFLFSGAASSSALMALSIGSVIDITSPSIMDGSSGSSSNSGTLKLSVNNANQIRLIGTAKDFGYCRSKRKDGKDCTAVVNTWECNVCVHHASSELKKMNYKKSKSNVSFDKPPKFGETKSASFSSEPNQEGVVTMNFGKPASGSGMRKHTGSTLSQQPTPSCIPVGLKKSNARMELQGTSVCNELKRNTLTTGNSANINFKQEKNTLLEKEPLKAIPSKPLNLDPTKTRHLTERDRDILSALDGTNDSNGKDKDKADKKENGKNAFSQEIASQIASNPSAGGLNLMKYLSKPDKYSSDPLHTRKEEQEPVGMTRKTLMNMKKALDFVKSNGPIRKEDPNAIKKKASSHSDSKDKAGKTVKGLAKGNSKTKVEVEFDFESEDFKEILNAKSAHEDTVNDLKQEEYFDKLTMKEAIENKMLNTFSVATNAVMCRQCKYVALSQSDFCKEQRHQIRVVKATKRFFKCKDCGNRTMSLDRLPKHRKLKIF
jgi:minichromosome maintenance protein 10